MVVFSQFSFRNQPAYRDHTFYIMPTDLVKTRTVFFFLQRHTCNHVIASLNLLPVETGKEIRERNDLLVIDEMEIVV